jgi:hypothetical protein
MQAMIKFVLPDVIGSPTTQPGAMTATRPCTSLASDRSRPTPLFCSHDREFKGNVLAGQLSVDRRERVEFVLERSRILRVEQPEIVLDTAST